MTHRPRAHSYLVLAGAFSRLLWPILTVVAAYVGYECYLTGYSEDGVIIWLLLFPVFAGTGLLTLAREGRLDLLLGSGVSRDRVFASAFARAAGVPILFAMLLAIVSLVNHGDAVSVAFRATAVALFTGACCFSLGLIEPRYAAGVAWIGARIVFLMTRHGFLTYHQLVGAQHGSPLPPWPELMLAALMFPESVLRPAMPISIVVTIASIGLTAAGMARFVFTRAEWPGHRTA